MKISLRFWKVPKNKPGAALRPAMRKMQGKPTLFLGITLVLLLVGCQNAPTADSPLEPATTPPIPGTQPVTPSLAMSTATYSPPQTHSPVSSASPSVTATPHPLFPYTIPGLRARTYPGGQIQIRWDMAHTASFSQYYIEYPSDGLTITGVMYVPPGEGPFPTLILLHGYVDRELYFAGADTWQAAEFFAGQGYLVISPDLRSWGESDPGLSLFHTGLTADVINLIASLETLPEADTDHIGLWGHSMGGGIATKVLAVAGNHIDAAVLYAPNSADDADLIARWGRGCLPGESETAGVQCNPAEVIPEDIPSDVVDAYVAQAQNPEFLHQVAPLFHLDPITIPIQIHIGTADGQFLSETPPEWSEKLAEALRAAGKEVEYYTYPGQGHAFMGESWVLFQTRALTFFDQRLK